MFEPIRWGILGTGNIAHKFARGLSVLPDAVLAAVGSRSQATADAFGDEFAVPRRHASYAALADDPAVDVIYISTPHSLHHENMLLCLEAGKAVLCEKPFTINAAETRTAIALAREKGLFLMEAMWTRFFPLIVELRQMLAEGAIGEVRMVAVDFGYRSSFNPQSRIFDPALGGGALLDVGVYPISFASMILGRPSRIVSMAELGRTGVDEQSAMILGYPGGALAVLTTAVRTNTPQEAIVLGSEGEIRIHSRFWTPDTMTITRADGNRELRRIPFEGNGYNYEAAEVARCLRTGETESSVMPLDETLAIMETMDTIRSQWGMKYPGER